jgi:hypothetical protein
MKRIVVIFLFIAPVWLFSQTGVYKPLGGGMYTGGVSSLAVDSTDNTLYLAGSFSLLGGSVSGYVAKWNGTIWDSIPELPNTITHFEYIDGVFYAYGDQSIWKKSGGIWTEIAVVNGYNPIAGIIKFNGNLLIMGGFDTLNTTPVHHFAQYDGTNILPFSNDSIWPMYEGGFSTAAVYNNELYVGGFFVDTTGDLKNIMKWDGSHWTSIGTKIKGGFAHVFKLLVYDNKLFIAGEFDAAAGNVGNSIFSFDGTDFDDLGGGLQYAITDMIVQNNQLYMVGACQTYTGREFKGFLSFNGTDFCFYDSIPCTAPYTTFKKMTFYNDSLVVAGAKFAPNGDTINTIAKYVGDYTVSQDCEQVIGIEKIEIINLSFSIYPNPATNQITLEFDMVNMKNVIIEIKNLLGHTLRSINAQQGKSKMEIDVAELPAGLYFIQLQNGDQLLSRKFIKQ